MRAGATPPDGDGEVDSEAVEAEKKAIVEGAAAAKALMDATDEFRAKQVRGVMYEEKSAAAFFFFCVSAFPHFVL